MLRNGWLLWFGARRSRLWTVSSLIETIRDILRRAYGVPLAAAFLLALSAALNAGMILGAVDADADGFAVRDRSLIGDGASR